MSQSIGSYQILSELGRGGMGVVYKAYEPALGRTVALKMLNDGIAHQPGLVERFYREARAMATLSDPNVVQIYAVGEHNGAPFFVMEYIDGESLGGRLKRERLSVQESRKLLKQAASGLQAAHEMGLIHRDIKPGNLMLTQKGTVKVTDFGIALAEGSGERLTGTGGIVGTPGYLSPEACLGEPIDIRTDVFALGVVFYEMLTGRLPFDDKSPYALMAAVVQAQIPDVRTLNSEVDTQTMTILSKMLARRPDDRFQSCAALVAALSNESAPISNVPLPPPRPVARPMPTPMPITHTPPPFQGVPAPVMPVSNPAMAPYVAPAYQNSYSPSAPTPAPPNAPWVAPQTLVPPAKSSSMPLILGGLGALLVVGWLALSNGAGETDTEVPSVPEQVSPTQPVLPDVPAPPQRDPERADAGQYSNLGEPNLSLSQLSAADMETAAESVLGTYTGKLDEAKLVLVLQSHSGGEIQGYNIANSAQRPLRGFVENFKEEIAADGETWRIYSVVLQEPGDQDNDGKFRVDLKHTDKYIAGDGSWTSYSGTQQFNISIENYNTTRE